MTEKMSYKETFKQIVKENCDILTDDFFSDPGVENLTELTVKLPILFKNALEHGYNEAKEVTDITFEEFAGLVISGVLLREYVFNKK
jgi:hypothetical protein